MRKYFLLAQDFTKKPPVIFLLLNHLKSTSSLQQAQANQFLSDGGEMGALTRSFDWDATSLGPVSVWPGSLKTTLGILLHSSFPMFLFWGEDLICFYNDAYRPSLGTSGKHPAVGKKGKDVWPEIWKFISPLIQQVMSEGKAVWFEEQLLPIYRNGKLEDVYWTFSYGPVYGDGGFIEGVFVTCFETTSKVNAFRALKQSNQRFQHLVSQATIGTVVLVGEENNIEIVNDAFASIIKRKSEELIGKKLFEAVPELREVYEETIRNIKRSGRSLNIAEKPVLDNSALDPRFFDLLFKPYVNDNNVITGVMILCQDVTEKVNARRRIEQSEERFQAAVEAVEGVVWTNSADGRMIGLQPGWSELTGQSPEEYSQFGWASAVHPDDQEPTLIAWHEAVRESKIFEFTHRLRIKDGSYRFFSIRAVPLKNDDGTIREWVGVHTDITEHHNAQVILMESEERFRSLADNSPMIVYIVDPNAEATMRYFNKTWLTYTGQTYEQALGRAWDGIVHPDDVQQVFDIYVPAFHQRIPYTLPAIRLKRHDGQYRWHLFKGNPRHLADGSFVGYVGVGIDIHEQQMVQNVLQESEERFRNLADNAPMFIWMVNEKAEITYANHELLQFLGTSDKEVVTIGGWEKVTHPDDLQRVYEAFTKGFANRQGYKVEARLRSRASNEYEWFLFKAAPRMLANGGFTGFIGTAVNIHQQKTLLNEMEERIQLRTKELNIANEALLQSNEDLKQFAHVASHDLKEPVRKIQTFTHRLNDEFSETMPPRAKGYVHKILRSAERMGIMIDGVLTYSSINAKDDNTTDVDLNVVIDNIRNDLEVLIAGKNASISKSHLPVIEGTEVLLYQLFYNLINNSLKFAQPDVAPVITIEDKGIGDETAIIHVTDNGIGFETEYAERIFESFTRLNSKDEFEGTGLGLSLCRKIVQRHGGTIEATSSLGVGSTFIIELPKRQHR